MFGLGAGVHIPGRWWLIYSSTVNGFEDGGSYRKPLYHETPGSYTVVNYWNTIALQTQSSVVHSCGGEICQQPGFQLEMREPRADVSPSLSIAKLRLHVAKRAPALRLFDLLIRFRPCGCMYAQERVFALLGLCSEGEQIQNEIDLQPSPEEVFKRAVLSHIQLYGDLNVLCGCLESARVRRGPQRIVEDGLWVDPDPPQYARMMYLPDLPSWSPNFTSFRVDWLLGPSPEIFRQEFRPIFDASHGAPKPSFNYDPAWRDNVLSLQGVEIDRVAAFHPDSPISFPAYQSKLSPFWESFWDWTCQGSLIPGVYTTADQRWVAFLRAMGAGCRCHGTDEMLSDAWVRHYAMEFFDGTPLEQKWRTRGLRGDRPSQAEDWYSPPKPHADPSYLPGIAFDKLCYFKYIRGMSGRVGLAPPRTRPGDRIVVLFGCSSPLLLEEARDRPGYFRIRGEAYMHGFMFGDAIEMMKQGLLEEQAFNLI